MLPLDFKKHSKSRATKLRNKEPVGGGASHW